MSEELEKFNTNIIKWYEFDKTESILQIGLNKKITEYLKTKFSNVKCVAKFNEIDFNEKFNYIFIYGLEDCGDFSSIIFDALDEDGKLLLVFDNPLGINKFSKFPLELNNGKMNIEKVKNMLNKNDNLFFNTFYVFPNYKVTDLIINENAKINEDFYNKYNSDIENNEIRLFDEGEQFKNIYINNPEMIRYLSNSYFIEISKKYTESDIKAITYNNYRKEEFQLITKIKKDIVEKYAANENAKKHIENMSIIVDKLKNEGFEILDNVSNGVVYSNLVKNNRTLDQIFADKADDLDYIVNILNKLMDVLNSKSVSYKQCEKYIKYIDKADISFKKLHFLKNGYWDLIAKNCFYLNDKFVFFDQEWEKTYLPVEYIIYRSIINSYELVKKIQVDDLLKKLNIFEYKTIFNELDICLMSEIFDKNVYEALYNKSFLTIEDLIDSNEECKRIKNEILVSLKDDNAKKQLYINHLEERIKELQEKNNEYERKNKRVKKIFFGKR